MFPLFSLARLISFEDQGQKYKDNLKIVSHTYANTGDRCLICLNFNLGKLFLWQKQIGLEPVFCWLPWFDSSVVVNTCIDPTGCWLLVLSTDGKLLIIPVRHILDPLAKIDQIWRLDHATEICAKRNLSGLVTCMTWWKTMTGQNVVILGTKNGELLFIDLVSASELLVIEVENEHILDIQILSNDSMTLVYILITTKANTQWRLVLERKVEIDLKSALHSNSSGYFEINGQYKIIYEVVNQTDDLPSLFKPCKVFQFPASVQLSKQNAKGHHFIAAHDLQTNVLKIYSSEVDQKSAPLFVYKLPGNVADMLYCDRLMFTASAGQSSVLSLLTNQKAEIGDDLQQVTEGGALVQEFPLGPEEKVVCLYKRSFPFNWHENRKVEESRPSVNAGVQLKAQTVLDGCVVITNCAVYECRPRISPERLFADLCMVNADIIQLERLAITIGLDVCSLAKILAEYKLGQNDLKYAERLFSLAKCSSKEVCCLLAKHGRIKEALRVCKLLLQRASHTSGNSVKTSSRKTSLELMSVKDLTMQSYVQLILECKDGNERKLLEQDFEDFLCNNLGNEKTVWKLLYRNNLHSLMWKIARKSGRLVELFGEFVKKRSFYFEDVGKSLTRMGIKTFTKDVEAMLLGEGHLLEQLESSDLGLLLAATPSLVTDFSDMLEDQLDEFSSHYILKIADLLNVACITTEKSIVNLFTNTGPFKETDDRWLRFVAMVTLYMVALLHISSVRGTEEQSSLKLEVRRKTRKDQSDMDLEKCEKKLVQCRYNEISASIGLNCVILDGKICAWDRMLDISGHENSKLFEDSDAESSDQRVRSYPVRCSSDVTVLSVRCGMHHSLAVTSRGVYSWGWSRYGQLGNGAHSRLVKNPLPVTSLKDEQIVKVCCGQHHSIALTEEGRVYTWGWGVFGQLGHSNAEDYDTPHLVKSLSDYTIVSIAAGQAHSVFLTKEGKVFTCGCNTYGQLGNGRTEKQSTPTLVTQITRPVLIIASKHFHTVALMENNTICQWGLSPMGLRHMLGAVKKSRSMGAAVPAHRLEQHLVPCVIDTSHITDKILQLDCGADFSALLTEKGEVYTWGKNLDGQLGCGTKQHHETLPVRVVRLQDVCITQVSCGPDFALAMDSQGRVIGWGRNEHGQLLVKAPMEVIRTIYRHGKQEKTRAAVSPIQLPFQSSTAKDHIVKEWEMVPETKERQVLSHWYGVHKSRGHIENVHVPSHLLLCLQTMGKFVNTELLLRKSLHLGSRECVSVMYGYLGRYLDAFTYGLSSLKAGWQANGDPEEKAGLIENVSVLFDNAVRSLKSLAQKKKSSSKTTSDNLERIVSELLSFWTSESLDLPTEDIEELLLRHRVDLAETVFLYMGRMAANGDKKTQFSTSFNIEMTSQLVSDIQSEPANISKVENKVKKVGYANFEGSNLMHIGERHHENFHRNLESSIVVLWNKVAETVKKCHKTNGKPVILSSQQYELLCSASTEVEPSTFQGDVNQSELRDFCAVLFSCSHLVTKDGFTRVVEEYTVTSQANSYEVTTANMYSILERYYGRDFISTGRLVVCPRCLIATALAL